VVPENFSIYLRQITDEVKAAIPDASFKAMEHLRGVAVEKAPLQTGNLRAGASVVPNPDGALVRFEGPYARYQEYGISHNGKELRHETGQSFYLVTSLYEEMPKILEIVTNELRRIIE
jgi:hypothetical protein